MDNIPRVHKTSDFTSILKRSAVDNGYYEDNFINHFVDYHPSSPISSIFHYLRTMNVRKVIERFMSLFPDKKVQFVNLGAGLDTISFWVIEKFKNVVCYETDFESQLRLKSNVMVNNDCFKQLLPDMYLVDGFIKSTRYKMIPFDLTKIDEFDRLLVSGLSRDLPTLFLAEFVFFYVDNDLVNKNLRLNVCNMDKYTTIESQVERYGDQNWSTKIICYNDFFNNNIEENERKRILELETFKDFKELGTWTSHFLVGICYKDESKLSKVLNLFNKNDTSSNDSGKYKIPFGNDYDNSTEFDKNYFDTLFIGKLKGSQFFNTNAYAIFDEFIGNK